MALCQDMALFLAGTLFWQIGYRYVIVTVVVSMGKICEKSVWFCNFSGDDMQRAAPIMPNHNLWCTWKLLFFGDLIALYS